MAFQRSAYQDNAWQMSSLLIEDDDGIWPDDYRKKRLKIQQEEEALIYILAALT